MKPNRRGFMQVLGGTVLAGRKAAEDAARKIAHIHEGGNSTPSQSLSSLLKSSDQAASQTGQKEAVSFLNWQKLRDDAVLAALKRKEDRGEIESILYEKYRYIHHLDSDLAINKSFSLAAKLAYQRQRIVERELDQGLNENWEWHSVTKWKEKLLSRVGLWKFLG